MARSLRMVASAIVFAILSLYAPRLLQAHGLRSALVEVTEIGPGNASIHLRLGVPDPTLEVATSSPCTLASTSDGDSPFDHGYVLHCPTTIAGAALEVRGLGAVIDSAVIWVSFLDGRTVSRLLDPHTTGWTLPTRTSFLSVASRYIELGIRHILTGYDHLLFLLLLALSLRDVRAVLVAETAFTLSHTLSFTASTLGLVRVSSTTAEACIALSLVLLALDVGRTRDVRPTLLRGAIVAFVFGLVHGLGFAGGLFQIGLPEDAIGAALAGFAAGVEVGQITFLALVLLSMRFATRLRAWPRFETAAAYVGGGLSTYWLIERLTTVLG